MKYRKDSSIQNENYMNFCKAIFHEYRTRTRTKKRKIEFFQKREETFRFHEVREIRLSKFSNERIPNKYSSIGSL